MKPERSKKFKLIVVLIAVLVVTGGIPFVAGTHVNDLLTPWRDVPDDATGVGLLDAAIDQASDVLDKEVAPQREEPQVPATFYHDWFPEDPTDRIGGWDDWGEDVDWEVVDGAAGKEVSVPWVTPAGNQHLQTREHDVDQGYRFGGREGYQGDFLDREGESLLTSPLISLRSLPVNIEELGIDDDDFNEEKVSEPGNVVGNNGATLEATLAAHNLTADDEGAIDLTAFLRRDLDPDPSLECGGLVESQVCDPVDDGTAFLDDWNYLLEQFGVGPWDNPLQDQEGRPQFDGNVDFLDRVLLYVDHRFNLACFDSNGNDMCDDFDGTQIGILPEGEDSPTFLSSLRAHQEFQLLNDGQEDDDSEATTYRGRQLNFTEEAFDLTPWAGQDVQLIFRVSPQGDPTRARQGLFEEIGCDPLCGWDISNLRIEGPAYQHNVRIDRSLYPLVDPEGGSGFVARPGDTPFQVLVLNRGSVTEDVEVRMDWEEVGEPGSGSCMVPVQDLRPGDAAPVKFTQETGERECNPISIEDASQYNVTFTVDLLGVSVDSYDHDNTKAITVTGDGPDIMFKEADGLRVDQNRPSRGQEVRVESSLWNRAITEGEVDMHLSIDYAGPDGFEETNAQDNANLVGEDVQDHQRVAVPQRSEVSTTWGFSPQEIGCYWVRLTLEEPESGEILGNESLVVGVRMTPDDDCGSDIDLGIKEVTVDTDYDWSEVGFGPGTDATATVTIRNNGFFTVDDARITLGIRDAQGSITWYNETLGSLALPGRGGDNVTEEKIPFSFPPEDDGKMYRFVFGVDLLGDLVEGVPLEDNNPANDCRSLSVQILSDESRVQTTTPITERDGGEACPFQDASRVLIESNPILDMGIEVTPEAGRTGGAFPRDLRLQVENRGNVEVENALLTLLVQHAQSDSETDHLSSWIIKKSPLPGHTASWEDLDLRNPLNETRTKQPEPQLMLLEDGMYFVSTFLYLDGEGEEREDVFRQLRLDAFDTVYSDTFEPRGVDMDFPDLVTGEAMIARNESWQRVRGEVPDPQGGVREQAMWRFGDPETGQYADDEDAALELPPIDLSSARRAVLAMSHNYNLEDGYDGARVESSLDGGETWLPLQPRQKYPGTVAADSPLNSERDPTVETRTFTGDSRDRETSGWVTDEFDLAQLPGFTSPVQLQRFDQDGMEAGPHMGDDLLRSEGGASWHNPSWAVEGDCQGLPLENCWYRDNVNWHNPLPLCDPEGHADGRLPSSLEKTCEERVDHDYWWSGSSEDGFYGRDNPVTSLSHEITINKDDINEGEEARIAFWYWKDEGGVLFAAEMPNGFSDCIPDKSGTCTNWEGEHRYRGNNNPDSDFRFGTQAPTETWRQGAFVIPDVHARLGDEDELTVTIRINYYDRVHESFSISGAGCACGGWGPENKAFSVSNRGAAVDGLELEVVDRSGAILSRTLVSEDNAGQTMASGSHGSVFRGDNEFANQRGEAWAFEECIEGDHSNIYDICIRVDWSDETQESFCGKFEDLCIRDGDDDVIDVDFGWSRVAKAGITNEGACDEALTCEAWGVQRVQTSRNEIGPVWQFGTEIETEDGMTVTYPSNVHQRLVTPRVDLSGVAGESANLTFWERYEMMYDILGFPENTRVVDDTDRRDILIQVVEPTPDGGERVLDWEPLGYQFVDDLKTEERDREGCTDDNPAWCPVHLDISEFIGQEVRFAFDVKTTRLAPTPDPNDQPIGWTWLIDEVTIEADSMTADSLHLRLRTGTDGSISEGHWNVQNLQLVGIMYENNVAVVPKEPLRDRNLGPGETLVFDGMARNMGPEMETDLWLDLDVVPVGDDSQEAPLPDVRFLRDRSGETNDSLEDGPVGPINLNAAGATNLTGHPIDRIPYHIEVELPEDLSPGVQYQFTLRLVTIENDHVRVVGDQNLGDHERVFMIHIKEEAEDLEGRLQVHPPTVGVGETTDFTLDLKNPGPTSILDDVSVIATRLSDNENTTIQDDLPLNIAPESTGTLTWNWSSSEPGFYRITATANNQKFYAHVMVDQTPLYYLEEFAIDPFTNGPAWTRNPEACGPMQQNCWRHVTQVGDKGSIFIGNDNDNSGYPAANSSWARVPAQDLSFLGKEAQQGEQSIVRGESPFSPYLSLKYQSILQEGDDPCEGHTVKVRANESRDSFTPLLTTDPHSDCTGQQGLGGLDEGTWHVASFPLFHENNDVLGTPERLLEDREVLFEFLAAWSAGNGRGFYMDGVTLSSYNVEINPDRHNITMRPGADKTFYFQVENTGAATDTYQVRLPENAIPPLFIEEGITVEVPEASKTLTLEPGESTLAPVRVSVPFENVPDISGIDLQVEVVSTNDPNRLATGLIVVDEFIDDNLPDLVMDLRRPSGETGPVGEGEEATFVVSVTNDGTGASRETDVVLFACPKERIDPETNEKKDVNSIKECDEHELARNLGEMRLPPLIASGDVQGDEGGDVWTTTVSWVPQVLHGRGNYTIIAVADPLKNVPQFSRDSSVDKLDLLVTAFEQPDLQVTDLRVTDANGNPVDSTFAGDVLNVEGTVVNIGDAPAPNVRVRILNQFALRDERIGDLNPGASHTMNAQWVAQPGNWVVRFEASTGVVEATTENNARSWSLAIRSGALETNWQPDTLHLDPGERADGLLQVHNHRDEAVTLNVQALTDDVTVSGLPGTLQIARGASTELPVLLTVSPFAGAGTQTVHVELVQRETGNTLSTATLEIHVAAERQLRLVPEPLHTPPGEAQLPLRFQNDGNAPESFTLNLEAPDGWSATAIPPTLRLDPGSQRTVQGVLEIPAGTPAGPYPIDVVADDILRETVMVDVVQQAVWRSELSAVHSHREPMQIMVRVANHGNIAAAPSFQLDGAEPAAFDVHPAPASHEPGEARTYRVTVPGSEASLLILPGRDQPIPLDAATRAPPVEAVRLDVQSAGGVVTGDKVEFRFGVRSTDTGSQQGLLASLWVDGELSADQRLSLEPGEERDVDFKWKVGKHGPRVVTATVSSGNEPVARTLVLDVQPSGSTFSIPGLAAPGVFVGVLFLAAIIIWRRWEP